MSQDAWNPERYDRFHDERSKPFFDLMALVHHQREMRVVDLGCGTGELTRLLHLHLQARETLGVDTSEAMLTKSSVHASASLRFMRGDLATFHDDRPYDLVFSNAALQWVDDHPAVLERLAGLLGPNGQLAVQVPANHDHPSHVVATEVASEPPFNLALGGYVRRSPVLTPVDYAGLLHRLGFREQHVRLQVYVHYLNARDDVIEWVRGTLLTDYESRLPADLFAQFLERYRQKLLPLLDDATPYFYPFKRILFWASR
ncbi:MAG TPA: methyltransferase domain-containing protein [Chloroflexota bacterium]|nr:methyltransferase domain-containing protein [Chloroflexota bacterium]